MKYWDEGLGLSTEDLRWKMWCQDTMALGVQLASSAAVLLIRTTGAVRNNG